MSDDTLENGTIDSRLMLESLGEIPDKKLERAVIDYVNAQVHEQFDRELEIVSALPQRGGATLSGMGTLGLSPK